MYEIFAYQIIIDTNFIQILACLNAIILDNKGRIDYVERFSFYFLELSLKLFGLGRESKDHLFADHHFPLITINEKEVVAEKGMIFFGLFNVVLLNLCDSLMRLGVTH